MLRHSRCQGFTLLEMIITLVVIGIMAAVGAQILGAGVETYSVTTNATESLSKARYTMARLSREVRETNHAGAAYDITTMNSSRFQFTKRDGETVDIQVSGSTVTLGYSSLSTSATLTDQVSSFTFAYYTSNGVTTTSSNTDVAYVEIQLTLLDGTARRLRVGLRNQV